MTVNGYGYGHALRPVVRAAPLANCNRVEYRRGSLTEWYVNGPLGLEQGFKLSERPGKTKGEPLTISLVLSGDLTPTLDQDRTSLSLVDRSGTTRLRYAGLAASDAFGKEAPAWLEVKGERLLLRVDDAGARYPLAVDPYVQSKLTAGGYGDFVGSSVAIVNNTLVVGAPAGGWVNATQTATLNPAPGAYKGFGLAVAINGIGKTVAVGGPRWNLQKGGSLFVLYADRRLDRHANSQCEFHRFRRR